VLQYRAEQREPWAHDEPRYWIKADEGAMERDQKKLADAAYTIAESKVERARKSGEKELNLSGDWQQNSPKLQILPNSLEQLRDLESLNLFNNQLVAVPEWLAGLKKLKSLNISANELTGLPESLAGLRDLEALDLSRNQLTEVPPFLMQLRKLKSLKLSGNPLTSLPTWLGELKQLTVLSLSDIPLVRFSKWLGQLTQLRTLDLSHNGLTVLPEWLGDLIQLQVLNLSADRLTTLPTWFEALEELRSLDLSSNKFDHIPPCLFSLTKLDKLDLTHNEFTSISENINELSELNELILAGNRLTSLPQALGSCDKLIRLDLDGNNLIDLPESFANLVHLDLLYLGSPIGANPFASLPNAVRGMAGLSRLVATGCRLVSLPDWVGELKHLESIELEKNSLTDLPTSLAGLERLISLELRGNPLNPELAAANEEGLEAVKRYLRARADCQVELNEAKLILIGEGEVGKSCLLSALRNDPWVEERPSTHGIEIKPVHLIADDTGKRITLNGWDFGGQRVYRPTHQLFFSAPAVYLVVWKPREGPQQGFVREWITLVKHRAPDAKIIVVATHGGPQQRQPDIDRQSLWDSFGKDMVREFFFIESKPDDKGGRRGIPELTAAIAQLAVSLPEMGRRVPLRWVKARDALEKAKVAYLQLDQVFELCRSSGMTEDEARDFIRVSHRLGHLIHYEHDSVLRDIVVLKPDWLATAISFVLDDEHTRSNNGLVTLCRLTQLWNDREQPPDFRYAPHLHRVFLRLMERFDLSYRVAGSPLGGEGDETSLIAQLVPDNRPEPVPGWPRSPDEYDEQQIQICRIVDEKTGHSAPAEGLFFRLIVRLHRYSLGRVNYKDSVHWQRGLVLEDDYGARALLEHVGNDVRITVRSPFPQAFLSALTYEVKWLVRDAWEGLHCDVMVPCIKPCGKGNPGTGLFEVEKLIDSKRHKRLEYPCSVCNAWQDIEALLRNAPAARPSPLEELLANSKETIRVLTDVGRLVGEQRAEVVGRFDNVDASIKELLTKVEAGYTDLMRTLVDEAKEGPRLFSFEPIDPGFFGRPKWINERFRLTLWCEHSRLPLPVLNELGDKRGIYEVNLPREWVVKAAPFLKILTGVLSLIVPVASSAAKLALDEAVFKGIEKQLEFGQKSIDSALKGADKAAAWLMETDAPDLERGPLIRAQGGVLRELHVWLKEKDASFGGLIRVQNRRREFLWVHSKFEVEY
jgi:Leucine-rich repeat (LRR) protein